ncbi:MAG: DUF1232 domain-containing protein [Pseudomonadota bacterium]
MPDPKKSPEREHEEVGPSPADSGYESAFSDGGFWSKLGDYALVAGREVVEKALLLYYATQNERLPVWAKTAIYGALGYFITLTDAIPDITPVVGYADDLGVLSMALVAVARYLDDDVRSKAAHKAEQWFGNRGTTSGVEASSSDSAVPERTPPD